ncbi:hypothetical protein GOP47_0002855 [Adiantum capillus-veneris]|uniref:Polygalacturonase n=1 Tax=Adiantum capillus-veneris TaxID=13818 RepID=A0A9D4VCV0_ADICA|nr:hypothetical protein GOP47_0002855 [Adiantum capillus-veneris]
MAHFSHQRSQIRRWVTSIRSSHRTWGFALWIFAFISVALWQRNLIVRLASAHNSTQAAFDESVRAIPVLRPHVFNLTQFGAVGDGKTLNTHAFELAVSTITDVASLGGGQLNVPPGVWLTAPFNLTSHMTLFLAAGSVILGTQVSTFS